MTTTRFLRVDFSASDYFFKSGQGHAGLGTVVHSGSVRTRGGVRQFLLARLLNGTFECFQGPYGSLDAHRISDLDGCRQRRFGLDGVEFPETCHETSVQRIGLFRLGANDTGQFVDETQIAHLHETLASALTFPRLPPGMMIKSGTSQSNC